MAATHAFRIVIAYDDHADGIRAWEMSERLAARFRSKFAVDTGFWKFDLLRDLNPRMREEAVATTAEADMIIISTRDTDGLPAHVQGWIESWLPYKQGSAAALVALLHQGEEIPDQPWPVDAYLRQKAEQTGMDYFCNVDDWRPRLGSSVATARLDLGTRQRTPVEVLHQDFAWERGWGLND